MLVIQGCMRARRKQASGLHCSHGLPSAAVASPLAEAIGRRVRELRGDVPQSKVADAARAYGLDWNQSSVSQLEKGTRGLSFDEALLLPEVLTAALGKPVELVDLIPTSVGDAEDVFVELGGGVEVSGRWLQAVLRANREAAGLDVVRPSTLGVMHVSGVEGIDATTLDELRQRWWPRASRAKVARALAGRHREAEQKAARNLGVPVDALVVVAHRRWGRDLTDERDARAAERLDDDASPRTVQAVRGAVTRELLTELKGVMG